MPYPCLVTVVCCLVIFMVLPKLISLLPNSITEDTIEVNASQSPEISPKGGFRVSQAHIGQAVNLSVGLLAPFALNQKTGLLDHPPYHVWNELSDKDKQKLFRACVRQQADLLIRSLPVRSSSSYLPLLIVKHRGAALDVNMYDRPQF